MTDSNISMEEDTELRDLVVQTLENNGALAKVRAELRASVFLTLEEQESLLKPEPLLNKTVKQYLANSEGKLLFSLVREFLEYFGLDCTMRVFDPETYNGKEYTCKGRKQLCEELGIETKEPLLGEILKNALNSALNNSKKIEKENSHYNQTNESSTNFINTTYDVSSSQVFPKNSSFLSRDSSEKLEVSNTNEDVPINIILKDKKMNEQIIKNDDRSLQNLDCDNYNLSLNDSMERLSHLQTDESDCQNANSHIDNLVYKTESTEKLDNLKTFNHIQFNQNEDLTKNKRLIQNDVMNVQNLKNKNVGNTLYFNEIIIEGKKEMFTKTHEKDMLGELPPLPKQNSFKSDLPPLNGKKTDFSELKETMNIAEGISAYDEDFTSSASGSGNEQSPIKILTDPKHSLTQQIMKEDTNSIQSEHFSEEIDEEIITHNSCLENINTPSEKSIANLSIK